MLWLVVLVMTCVESALKHFRTDLYSFPVRKVSPILCGDADLKYCSNLCGRDTCTWSVLVSIVIEGSDIICMLRVCSLQWMIGIVLPLLSLMSISSDPRDSWTLQIHWVWTSAALIGSSQRHRGTTNRNLLVYFLLRFGCLKEWYLLSFHVSGVWKSDVCWGIILVSSSALIDTRYSRFAVNRQGLSLSVVALYKYNLRST